MRTTAPDPESPFNGVKALRITSKRQAMAFLRHVRAHLGWTQRKTAAASGIRQTSIAAYETGGLNPSMDTFLELGRGLGYDLWWVPQGHVVMVLRPDEWAAQSKEANGATGYMQDV